MPVRDQDGRPCGTVALHRDLRRPRRAEAALRATREELRVRFSDSPLPQSLVDLTGQVLAVNPAMEQLLGRDARDVVGRSALELYGEQDRAELERMTADLVAGRSAYARQDRTLVRPDGRRLEVVVTVTVVHDADGQPLLAGSAEDVTALRRAERELAAQAARFEALLESMPVVVFTYDRDGVCTSSRGQALALFGRQQDESVGSNLLEVYDNHAQIKHALFESLAGRAGVSTLEIGLTSWTCHYRPLLDDGGRVQGGMGVAVDVTAQRAAERQAAAHEARLTSLLRHAHDVALVLDLSGRIVYASASARHHLGYEEADLFWREAASFNHPDDRELVAAAWLRVLSAPGAVERFECRVRHADGTWRWADHVLTNLVDDPAVRGIVVNVKESTERRRAEEELRQLALHDRLTGLANRTLLLDRLERALASGRRSGNATGLVLLDVRGMGGLNERLGQPGGDAVLRVLAARLAAAVSTGGVARVGGDAFAVLAEDVASEEDLRSRAAALVEVADDPVEVDGQAVRVVVQVGTALTPARDAGALLAAAERSAATTGPRGGVGSTRSAVADEAPGRAAAAEELRRALREGQMVLHYQPVVRLDTGDTAGFEALVRWQHPERGLLPPADFIHLAEATGVIVDLGAWVLREAVAQLVRWRDRPLGIGVNLSARQLVDPALPTLLRDLVSASGIDAGRLVLEVTESALIDDPAAEQVLSAVRALGVHLALDDFGTGYSSLTYLKRFPVDAIKIDRSFVAGLGRDPDDEAIVASVVSLGRAIGKTLVAEGVETADQLEALRALGVEQGQGFLWSRPLPVDDVEEWLMGGHPVVPAAGQAPALAQQPSAAVDRVDEARILALHGQGASLHTIAAALNAEGRRTPAGPRWTPTTVARVIAARVPRV